MASAASFAGGAALPLVVAAVVPVPQLIGWVTGASVACLACLGALAAGAGGAPKGPAALRVTILGALAMAVTAGVGALFGAVV